MEVIDVGEVAVEEVIEFILSKDYLKKLSGPKNSVSVFVLAHQMALPDLFKALINNSETIDATTRDFVDFIIFYGNDASIIEEKYNPNGRYGERYKINGLSTSEKYSTIELDKGVEFSDILTKFVKYKTEKVNLRHLSNHMTRAALTLMQKYHINEYDIPSLLFINPENVCDYFLAKIDSQNPIIYIYEKILKPLSISFHEIEEFHLHKGNLGNLKRQLEEAKNIIEDSPEKIKLLEKELLVLEEKLSIDKKEEDSKIKLLEERKIESLSQIDIKYTEILASFNLGVEKLELSISQREVEIQKLKKEKYELDSGIIIFKSIGQENLLKAINNKRLLKAITSYEDLYKEKNLYYPYKYLLSTKDIADKISRDTDSSINHIKSSIKDTKNDILRLNGKINQTKKEYDSSTKFILEFDNSTLDVLQDRIFKHTQKLHFFGLKEFVSDSSQKNTLKIIRHVLVKNNIKTVMGKLVQRDVFICHSSEDKEPYVNELYKSFELNDIKYWFDKNEIRWGDSIVSKVNEGLRISKYVLVVLSLNSIKKKWPKAELEASLNLEFSTGNTRVLPLLLGNEEEIKQVLAYYPILSSKLFVKYSDGVDKIIEILKDRLS